MKTVTASFILSLLVAGGAMANSVTTKVGSGTYITTTTDGNGGGSTRTCTSVGSSIICN